MEGLIFSEGNGYGHAARDLLLSNHFNIPIMTFGKGAEYCRQKKMNFIEIPTPYKIENDKGKIHIATNLYDLRHYLKPSVYSKIQNHFKKVDFVIVDGSPLGLAIAMASNKKTIFITNDTTALVGVNGNIQKIVALSLLKNILKYPKAIVVPDFAPPFTISADNLDHSLNFVYSGPLINKIKQKKHKYKYLVPGNLEKQLKPILGKSAIYGGQNNLEYYSDCEIVFCHGGHTTIMEALSYGKPTISIVDSSYSERINNVKKLQQLDIGLYLDKNSVSAESITNAIDYAKTLNKKRLELYSKMATVNPLDEFDKLLSKLL